MYNKFLLACWLSLTLIYSIPIVSFPHRLPIEAHVHGIATLDIVMDGNSMLLEFRSPATNLLGFEHVPINDMQKTVYHSTRQTLAEANRLFSFETALCQVKNTDIQMPEIDSSPRNDQFHDQHEEHSDIRASYLFKCQQTRKLKEITVQLLALFPGIHQLKVQWVTEHGQGTVVLTPDHNVFKIDPMK